MLFLRSNIDLARALVLQGEDIDDTCIETITLTEDEGYGQNNESEEVLLQCGILNGGDD